MRKTVDVRPYIYIYKRRIQSDLLIASLQLFAEKQILFRNVFYSFSNRSRNIYGPLLKLHLRFLRRVFVCVMIYEFKLSIFENGIFF